MNVINGYFHICMEVKNSVLVKRNQPVSHGACRFVFSLIASDIILLPWVCSSISWAWWQTSPFGFSGVKSVYADLKAFQVHVRDTGNSQVKGEQLHKSSVGTKARVFLLEFQWRLVFHAYAKEFMKVCSITEYTCCGATLLTWFKRS